MGKVIDCILFNDEIDLLRLRIDYLSDSIDEFIIFESCVTFSGRPKPLYAKNMWRDLEEKSNAKISFWHSDLEHMTPKQFSERWPVEHETRKQFLERVFVEHSNDRIIFGDIDEFPSLNQVEMVRSLLTAKDSSVYGLDMPTFYRYVNWFVQGVGERMNASKTFVGSNPPALDLLRVIDHFKDIEGIGAHLSYLGMSADKRSKKFSDFSHSEFSGHERIEHFVDGLQDFYAIDHIGRFFFEGNGLLKVLPLEELPNPCSFLTKLNVRFFKNDKLPNRFRRLVASATVTLLRKYMMRMKKPRYDIAQWPGWLFSLMSPLFFAYFWFKGFFLVVINYLKGRFQST